MAARRRLLIRAAQGLLRSILLRAVDGLLRGVLLASVGLAAACVQNDGRRFNPIRNALEVSVQDEREAGFAFDQEMEQHARLIDDYVVNAFLTDLGQAIVEVVGPQPFLYQFRVVDANSLNAFAVPGGYVYFHSETLLAASEVEEVVGVMAHEVAHVKGRHYARLREKSMVPDIVAGLGGLATAVATGQPGAAVTAQGANVALKLRWTREVEAEADRQGVIYMTRAGFDAAEMARFFDRILAEKQRNPIDIPPYLYSHPDIEERAELVRAEAERLRRARPRPVGFDERFRAVQRRLAILRGMGRTRLPARPPEYDRVKSDFYLERAEALARNGDKEEALAVLAEGQLLEPRDPRLFLRAGDILAAAGRDPEALVAYRHTVDLDSSNPLALYRAARAAVRVERPGLAIFYLDQARLRSRAETDLRRRIDWEIEKLTFPVVEESGLADGSHRGETVAGDPREHFRRGDDDEAVWWGRVGERFGDSRKDLRVRWTDPTGRVVQDESVETRRKPFVSSQLKIDGDAPAGTWTVEALLGNEPVVRDRFELEP